MLSRGVLDITWSDLAFGLVAGIRPGDYQEAQIRARDAWSDSGDALCALSVRSGFDAMLTALDLPAGGEVLVSALTIEDMSRILERHGLVAVPVDLDMSTLSVSVHALDQARSPRTCAVLVAHLFGSRMLIDQIAAFARGHDLFLFEDCAQAYTGPEYTGHPHADVAMFSFGPIKTNTALGGAILRVKDPALRTAMNQVQAEQPVQRRRTFLRKVVKYGAVKFVSRPVPYSILAATCRRLGTDHDAVIGQALRGFSGPDFFDAIRRRPSYPLLALLERRLRTFDPSRIQHRRQVAESFLVDIPHRARVGDDSSNHSHWIVPITSSSPDLLIRRLWSQGFDATRGRTSLGVVAPPPDRPELAAVEATKFLESVVYLPVHLRAGSKQLARLCRIVAEPTSRVERLPR